MRGGGPFALAGLWERWEGEGGPLETCTLLTTQANGLLTPYHDRMPVILRPEDYDRWLDAGAGRADALRALLRPYPEEEMAVHEVSQLVNSPAHDDPRCVEALAGI